jgi:hypothetical protein
MMPTHTRPALAAGALLTAIAAGSFIGGGSALADQGRKGGQSSDDRVGNCVSTLVAGGTIPGIVVPPGATVPELVAACKLGPTDLPGDDNGVVRGD